MTWIDALISNFLAIINFVRPFRVLRPYERGVVFRMGLYHRTMQPGLRWLIPFGVDDVELVGVAEETQNLVSQSATTTDGDAVTFSVNIVFQVVDPQLYVCAVHDFDASVSTYAMTHFARRVRELTWAELLAQQKDLERSMEGTLSTRVKKWGAEIISVGFTDLVKSRQFRLFGDPARTQ